MAQTNVFRIVNRGNARNSFRGQMGCALVLFLRVLPFFLTHKCQPISKLCVDWSKTLNVEHNPILSFVRVQCNNFLFFTGPKSDTNTFRNCRFLNSRNPEIAQLINQNIFMNFLTMVSPTTTFAFSQKETWYEYCRTKKKKKKKKQYLRKQWHFRSLDENNAGWLQQFVSCCKISSIIDNDDFFSRKNPADLLDTWMFSARRRGAISCDWLSTQH